MMDSWEDVDIYHANSATMVLSIWLSGPLLDPAEFVCQQPFFINTQYMNTLACCLNYFLMILHNEVICLPLVYVLGHN